MSEPSLSDIPESPAPQGTLRARAVSRSFEGVQALDDVTLELRRHEVVGLIGPNGAGKSTLVNLMTGFDFPSAGTIELGGREITGWSPHRRGRAGLARTFQHSKSFRDLSVRENVEVAALGVGAAPREARRRADELLPLLGLTGRQHLPAGSLAHGDERRLGVARALAMEPSFVLMDEPAAGLPGGRGAGVRRRRARGARRSRRGRAPDRPQHGADHGRLRPHPRARPGRDARARGRRARSAPTSTSPRPTSARAPCRRTTRERRDARDRRPGRELRRRRRGARRVDRGRPGRDRRPDRPERRGQVDDAARDHGTGGGSPGRDPAGRRARCAAGRPRTSRARASRSCPRGGASSPS